MAATIFSPKPCVTVRKRRRLHRARDNPNQQTARHKPQPKDVETKLGKNPFKPDIFCDGLHFG